MMTPQLKLVMFDLDDTLAKSKCDMEPDMAALLGRLLETRYVSVISGCKWEQFHQQAVKFIDPSHFSKLIIAPVSGGLIYRYRNGEWQVVNETSIGISFDQIVQAFEATFAATGFERPTQLWGPEFEDRICQVTYSGLGQLAPHEEKKNWDPDFSRRNALIADLKTRLPSYLSVRAGGSTSIDVSGFEKDYGIRQVILQMKNEGITEDDLLFVGDAIFPGGNDYSVTKTNVRYIRTDNPTTTRQLIQELLDDEESILARCGRGPVDG